MPSGGFRLMEQNCVEIENLPAEVWNVLRASATYQDYRPGCQITQQDRVPHHLHVVVIGMVKTVCIATGGDATITGLHSSGWFVCPEAVIAGVPYRTSVFALSSCRLATIPAETFLNLVRTNQHLSWYLHKSQSQEVADLSQQQMLLRTAKTQSRFSHFLCGFLRSTGQGFSVNPVELDMPLKKHEMAQLLAISPEHLSRVEKAMEAEGVIQRNKRSLTVMNPDKLYRSIQFL